MALNADEKKELKELRERAESAEASNAEMTETLDSVNVEIAQAAIDKKNAVDDALEKQKAEFAAKIDQASTGRIDKSISPKTASKFDPSAYYCECFGGDAKYVQNGWFYDNQKKPMRPTNKPEDKE